MFEMHDGTWRCSGPDGTTFELTETDDGSGIVLGDDEQVFVPVAADPAALAAFHATYIAPTVNNKPMPFGVGLLASVAAAREGLPADALDSPTAKSVRFFIGNGDWDDVMVSLENAMTMHSMFALELGLQATANNGRATQQRTRFSRSLVTIERWPCGNTALFVAQVDYEPHLDERGHAILASQAPDNVAKLPHDMPLDAARGLHLFGTTSLEDLASRMKDQIVPYAATLPIGKLGDIVAMYDTFSDDDRYFLTALSLNRPDSESFLYRVLDDPQTTPAVAAKVREVLEHRDA